MPHILDVVIIRGTKQTFVHRFFLWLYVVRINTLPPKRFQPEMYQADSSEKLRKCQASLSFSAAQREYRGERTLIRSKRACRHNLDNNTVGMNRDPTNHDRQLDSFPQPVIIRRHFQNRTACFKLAQERWPARKPSRNGSPPLSWFRIFGLFARKLSNSSTLLPMTAPAWATPDTVCMPFLTIMESRSTWGRRPKSCEPECGGISQTREQTQLQCGCLILWRLPKSRSGR